MRSRATLDTLLETFAVYRARKLASLLLPSVSPGDRVLDFGCGDGRLGREIARESGTPVVGVDVVAPTPAQSGGGIEVQLYDGRRLPFDDGSFDVTYAAFVLHHTEEPAAALREVLRVTRKRVVLLEDVYRNGLELRLTRWLDSANQLAAPGMPIPFNFLREEEWHSLFRAEGVARVSTDVIRPAIPGRPTRHRRFVLELS